MKSNFIWLLYVILTVSSLVYANNTATLSGTVKDADTWDPLQNTNIVLEGTFLGAAVNAEGEYIITGITPGVYTLVVTRIGYESFRQTKLRLEAGKETILHIMLKQAVIKMRDIQVEADKFQTEYRDIDRAGSHSLEPRNISKIAGSMDDITRAVQLFGGVVPDGDYTSFYTVRGGSPDQNIVLLDGLVVANPYRLRMIMGGGVSLFNQYSSRDVALLTGNFPVEYGNFLSSVMNVTSRDGRTDHIGYGASVNFLDANAYAEGPWPGKQGSWLITARRSYFDLLAQKFYKDQTSYPHTLDVDSKFTYLLNKYVRISLKTLQSREHTDLSTNDNEDIGLKENSLISFYSFTLDYYATPKTMEKIKIAYYDEQFDNSIFIINENGIETSGDYKTRIYTTTIKEDFSYNLTANHTLNRGMQFLLDRSLMDVKTQVNNITFSRKDVPPYVMFSNTSGHYNTYLDYTGRLFPFLQVKAGVRYDYSFLINKGDASPRLSMLWTVKDNLFISGFWGICYQYPNVFSIFTRDYPLNISANLDNLYAEKASHSILGITKIWGMNYLTRLEVYYKDLDRLLLPSDYTHYIPENSGSGYATGIEISLEKGENEKSRWYAMLSYAWSRSEYYDCNDITRVWKPFNFDRRHGLTVNGKYKPAKNLSIDATWRYSSGLPYNTIIAYMNAGQDGCWFMKTNDNARRYPYYQRIDIRFNYGLQTTHGLWNFYVDFSNILNRKNIYNQAWFRKTDFLVEDGLMRGIDSYQDVLKQRNIYMLPFLPSLGVSYNF